MSKQSVRAIKVGIIAYLALPIIVYGCYVSRGYFGIGGEWLVLPMAMMAAYSWEDVEQVASAFLLAIAGVVLFIASKIYHKYNNTF